jgi:hypothetical protein
VWAVRSDGVLLGLTYVREHEIVAWHHHDFENGIVENVCVVPENDEDAVYLCVKRTIDGSDVRYIERMQTRAVQDIKDLVIMDSAITYDGRNTNGSHTMDLSGGTTWDNTETLTLTSSTAFFASTDVGNQIHLNTVDADGNITDQIRFTIKAFSSSTVVTGKAHKH